MGGDYCMALGYSYHYGFLLTPPRGGRPLRESISGSEFLFLLTPPRGGRHELMRLTIEYMKFLLAPRRGGETWIAVQAHIP